jgi:hypothetical protein
MNTSIEDCHTYTFQTSDGPVTCQLHPNHFGFLQNYTDDENPIELFDITQKEADEGIKLYQHYLVFHQLMKDIENGITLPDKETMGTVTKSLIVKQKNVFLDWLHFNLTPNELNVFLMISGRSPPDKLEDSIYEYYWFKPTPKNQRQLTDLITIACVNNNLTVLKWLVKSECFSGLVTDQVSWVNYWCNRILHAMTDEFYEQVTFIALNTVGKALKPGIDEAVSYLCSYGIIKPLTWMIKNYKMLFSFDIHHTRNFISSHDDDEIIHEELLRVLACNITNLKYMISMEHELGKFDIHAQDEALFRSICLRGDLESVKFLISLEPTHDKINIHANDENAFIWACRNGHLEVAKWLLSLEPTHGKINIHANDENAFICACRNGHLEVAKWLLSLESTQGKINIHANDENAFIRTCENGHLEVAKWLLSLEPTHGKINIHAMDDLLFKTRQPELKKWMHSLETILTSNGDVNMLPNTIANGYDETDDDM